MKKTLPLISIQNISHIYRENIVLSDISLDISRGDISILRGVSGSGKSTFLRILAGIDMPSSGTILYDGMSTRDPQFDVFYRDHIGTFFTDSLFFESSTARENIFFPSLFGDYRFSRTMFDTCVELLEIHTFLDVPMMRLSTGQRERIALTRMLVSEPTILILDEPFSHLDERLYSVALGLLDSYLIEHNATLWVVTHDRGFILRRAKEYRMNEGFFIS